jgi:hypothetical protein
MTKLNEKTFEYSNPSSTAGVMFLKNTMDGKV